MDEWLRRWSMVRRIQWLVALITITGGSGAAYVWWQLGGDPAGLAGQAGTLRTILLCCALASGALASMGAWAVSRSIKAPVEATIEAISHIARGDLDTRIESPGRDELAWMRSELNSMRKKLRGLVIEVRDSASTVDVASEEIERGNADLSHRTEQQAAALQQTSASMQHIATRVRQNHAHADEVNQLVHKTSEVAGRGGQLMSEVVVRMNEIQASAQKIGEIIGVIDGIAFQTNILALNAAVEAARAGEHGRGFAVVAGEVRTLASRSAAAAREIKALIHDSHERVEAGSRLVSDAGRTMGDIVGGVDRVATVLTEMVEASSSQANDVGEVHDAIARIDDVTQQNASLVEQVAAASTSLRQQSGRLSTAMKSFQVAAA